MKHCVECGEKLELKELEHEGLIPYCNNCNEFRFPIFSSAVSMIVLNKTEDKVLLVKQYGTGKYRLPAGYINKGEDAEETVVREMEEELGVRPIKIQIQRTKYFEKSNTLMINFSAVLDSEEINPNYEIDEYAWFPIEEGLEELSKATIALYFFKCYMDERNRV